MGPAPHLVQAPVPLNRDAAVQGVCQQLVEVLAPLAIAAAGRIEGAMVHATLRFRLAPRAHGPRRLLRRRGLPQVHAAHELLRHELPHHQHLAGLQPLELLPEGGIVPGKGHRLRWLLKLPAAGRQLRLGLRERLKLLFLALSIEPLAELRDFRVLTATRMKHRRWPSKWTTPEPRHPRWCPGGR